MFHPVAYRQLAEEAAQIATEEFTNFLVTTVSAVPQGNTIEIRIGIFHWFYGNYAFFIWVQPPRRNVSEEQVVAEFLQLTEAAMDEFELLQGVHPDDFDTEWEDGHI